MGKNWVSPDTRRRRLKAINSFCAGLFFDLLGLHNLKKFIQTAAWLFAVLLALQNFQNLQSAYNQKQACLATTPFPSGGSAAPSTPERRGFSDAWAMRQARQAEASALPVAGPTAAPTAEASPAAAPTEAPVASPSAVPPVAQEAVDPSAYSADVASMASQVDDLVKVMIAFLVLLSVAAGIMLLRPVWRNFKLVYHRKVPRLHRGEPMEKAMYSKTTSFSVLFPEQLTLIWYRCRRLLTKTALSALYGAGFLLFLAAFLVISYYLYKSHRTILTSSVACSRDPGSFDWIWLAVIIPLAVLYCLVPLTSAWVNPLKRHLFRRNRLYWIADQPIYIRNGSINFDRRDADERDPKILTYDDYIAELKEALIRKDASLDEINTIRERMNVALESLAGCLSERIMENDDRSPAESEPRLSYLTSNGRGRFARRRDSIDVELDEYPTFRSSSQKSMKR